MADRALSESSQDIKNTIVGVELKVLKSHPDDRGFFREIIRSTDDFFPEGSFAQWSHSKMGKDVVKAWHYHHLQTDWWYLGIGTMEVVLYDHREESPSYGEKMVFTLGEDGLDACVCIPPGVLHAGRVLSDEAHLFYITSKTYNPDDEGRFPFNNGPVAHDWGPNPIVSEKDRVAFIPKANRQPIA